MATACCTPLSTERRSASSLVVALAGNPNVGKSTLFNRLTGSAVETADYPGMTVGLNVAAATWAGQEVQLVDLPGTYALDPVSEDQWVARHGLLDWQPDVVIAVVDATNLARNLYLVLQIVDLGPRVVIALNLIDEAHRQSLRIDPHALSQALGLPVIPTVARRGEGLDELVATAAAVATGSDGLGRGRAVRYSAAIEAQVADLEAQLVESPGAVPEGLPPRAAALALLEGDDELHDGLRFDQRHRRLGRARHAGRVHSGRAPRRGCGGRRVLHRGPGRDAHRRPLLGGHDLAHHRRAYPAGRAGLGVRLSVLRRRLAVAAADLAVGRHGVAGAGVGRAQPVRLRRPGRHAALGPRRRHPRRPGGRHPLHPDLLLRAGPARRLGLHERGRLSGRPRHAPLRPARPRRHSLMAAAGCNVPAIMGTRVLSTKRERTIACTLVVLVPCSARTAVILGSVSLFVGWQWALFVFGVLGLVGLAAGLLLNRILPGEPEGLVMEMFPFRRPSLRLVAVKTWKRFGTFLWAAAPIMLIGSFALGALYETGLIWHLEWPLHPVVVGWLGLPAVAGLTLLLGVLRKELALQMLVVFAVARYGAGAYNLRTFMTAHQIVVYALVASILVPCVATIAMLGHELGWRRAATISAGTVATALVIGGAVSHLLPLM